MHQLTRSSQILPVQLGAARMSSASSYLPIVARGLFDNHILLLCSLPAVSAASFKVIDIVSTSQVEPHN